MLPPLFQKILPVAVAAVLLWLGGKYLLPLLLPFFLGALLALAAEPAVSFGVQKLHWRRGPAAIAGTALTLVLLLGVISLAGALAVKELGTAAKTLPDLQQTAQDGISRLQEIALQLAQRAPEAVQPLLTQGAGRLFEGGLSLTDRALGKLPQMFSRVLGKLPGGALGVGTGILSAFMISVRLPRLKAAVGSYVPEAWRDGLKRVRLCVGGWLKAQAILSALTWGIVTVGFWLLKIPNGPVWAALVALVDAVPMLGTGIVLLPWALVSFFRSDPTQALGLVAIYGCAVLCRTVLEPRLVGRQLGLDPLLTLIFLYAGFRLWGVVGMILAPVLAAAIKGLFPERGHNPEMTA